MKINSGAIIRTCLVTLPVGIILIGAGCIYVTTNISPPKSPAALAAEKQGELPVKAIRRASIASHLDNLSTEIGDRHAGKIDSLNRARFYVESILGPSNHGYPIRAQSYAVQGVEYVNIEATLTGKKWPDEIVVIGAHYDTVPGTPGADDNGSGVAALLALAEAFVRAPQPRTLRFVAFTNEEPPFFQTPDMGSHRYAKMCKERGDKIVAMLSLESLGYYSDAPDSQKYPPVVGAKYPKTGNFIAVVGNLSSKELVDFTHDSVASTGLIPVEKGAFPAIMPGVGWSDHWAFWQFDYPAVMLTGTAPYRNPHYHLASDTVGTLDLERLTDATSAIRQAVVNLASQESLSWR